jgi:plasmid stabilization system protein ParE
MTRWVLSTDAADDLDQLVDFLLAKLPQDAIQTVDLITDALAILEQHPKMGRPVEQGLRELVISRGRTGYLALYQYDEAADMVVVLAVRHQREQDYH